MFLKVRVELSQIKRVLGIYAKLKNHVGTTIKYKSPAILAVFLTKRLTVILL